MSSSPRVWRTEKFVVEIPVCGPVTGRQLARDLEVQLREYTPEWLPTGSNQVGRVRVKQWQRVMSARR
jgi:hypothetical protein